VRDYARGQPRANLRRAGIGQRDWDFSYDCDGNCEHNRGRKRRERTLWRLAAERSIRRMGAGLRGLESAVDGQEATFCIRAGNGFDPAYGGLRRWFVVSHANSRRQGDSGTYTATVTATSGSLSHQAAVTVIVQ
jgi:hypothetical protein